MSGINDEKDRLIIEELSVTNRLLTDLTKAGSWVVNYAPDGSVASVQWGDGFRRLMGYSDRSDFPDEIESFVRGIHSDEDVQHSMQAGLNAHLCKPVEPDVLFKTLDSLLHD